jgi:hypothetical protein
MPFDVAYSTGVPGRSPDASAYVSPIWTRFPSGCVAWAMNAGMRATLAVIVAGSLRPHAASLRSAMVHKRWVKLA